MAPRSLITSLAFAIITLMVQGSNAQAWAQFCDDNACSVNCGESVDVNDVGCLTEYGRNSVLFHGASDSESQEVHLIWSPDDACSCQNDCVSDIVGWGTENGCFDMNGHQGASSQYSLAYNTT